MLRHECEQEAAQEFLVHNFLSTLKYTFHSFDLDWYVLESTHVTHTQTWPLNEIRIHLIAP